MKASADHHHGIGSVSCLCLLLSMAVQLVGAQPVTQSNNGNPYPYTTFSPSMAIIIVVLIAALFFMGFCSIYIRHCSDGSVSVGSIRRALSIRSRRAAAARGLDPSVIETFPTFTYSDVKDHKIGKDALECAVCLNEFAEDETLRLLPKCDHVFHPECIDAWLESHVTCPVCRANLTPQGAEETEEQEPGESTENDAEERARNVEIAIQVDDEQHQGVGEAVNPANQSQGLEYPTRPPRAWSVRRPKMFGLGKFRSHSTGHSLVVPGENLERFTLRLPEVKRKEVMDRAMLNRTRSWAPRVAIEHGSNRGYRAAAGEGSSRIGRFNWKFERSERGAKSDRWGIFTRGMSMKSTKVVADGGDGSGSSRAPVRMPSLKCLEPKTVDEAGLISGDPTRS